VTSRAETTRGSSAYRLAGIVIVVIAAVIITLSLGVKLF